MKCFLVAVGLALAACRSAAAGDHQAPPNWSVELSQVTTLAPLGQGLQGDLAKVAAVAELPTANQLTQDSLFDDSREFPTASVQLPNQSQPAERNPNLEPLFGLSPSGASNQLARQQPFVGNSTRWMPTKALYELHQPATFSQTMISTMQQQQQQQQQQAKDLVTLELLSTFLRQNPIPLIQSATTTTTTGYRPPLDELAAPELRPSQLNAPKVISRDLLQKALAIQNSLNAQLDQRGRLLAGDLLTARSGEPTSGARAKGFKLFAGKGELQLETPARSKLTANQIKRLSKSSASANDYYVESGSSTRHDQLAPAGYGEFQPRAPLSLVGEPYLVDSAAAAALDSAPLIQAEPRHFKLDSEPAGAASHHYPAMQFAYPAPGAYVSHARVSKHEKGLVTPILVGVVAALLSFLIISNLFLSIPLFAITLWQLFNGNMMMMMPTNGNNAMPVPSNSNANNNSPGGQQPAPVGRRRRRKRHIDSDARRILASIDWLSDLYESQTD